MSRVSPFDDRETETDMGDPLVDGRGSRPDPDDRADPRHDDSAPEPDDPATAPAGPAAEDLSLRVARLKLALAAVGVAAAVALAAAVIVFDGRLARIEKRLSESVPATEPAASPAPSAESERLRKELEAESRRSTELRKSVEKLESRLASLTTVVVKMSRSPGRTEGEPPSGSQPSPPVAVGPSVPPAAETKTQSTPLPTPPRPPTAEPAPDGGPAGRLASALGPLGSAGEGLLAVRDLPTAAAAYRELAAAEVRGGAPNLSAETYLDMARAANLTRRWAEALHWSRKASESLPPAAKVARLSARKLEALAARRVGRHDLAVAAAEAAINEDPKWAEGHRIRVRSLLAAGQLAAADSAAADFARRAGASSSAAVLESAWVALAAAEAARGRSAEESARLASRAAESLRKAGPPPAAAAGEWSLAEGFAALLEDRAQDALRPLAAAREQRPRSPSAFFLTGLAMARLRRFDDADAALARACELAEAAGGNDDADDPPPVAPPDWPEAEPALRAARGHLLRGRLMLAAGNASAAEERFRNAYLRRGDLADAYVGAAEALLRMGNPADALDSLRDALDADPKSARGHFVRAVALADSAAKRGGADADAVSAIAASLARALELDPSLRGEAAASASLSPLASDKRIAALLTAPPPPPVKPPAPADPNGGPVPGVLPPVPAPAPDGPPRPIPAPKP
jgi:tetratricopeptide (TPR) repeat protein